ncbi:hypothetical protein C1I98_30295 [Spongiactinospora gelatinilytica]|uniref:Uncharacterized protein n=1 Tax=Spongiactinospora gelatinilytica TaxID=2666298 RepID=A0A2W2GAR0_9ACTN|nr:DUF5708 family protein [Spongiactinospora gelatinilytica]PZG31247.1 hypothetical protein C1I98_30295 [Spongiactinospora gelatinilytica]
MASPRKTLITGPAMIAVGAALWRFGLGFEIVVFTPSKIGIVLMAIGGVETLYGLYKMTTAVRRTE